jgi:ArsR family transcriptional regulator, cadmium/lead-responsive transcriptional repressor
MPHRRGNGIALLADPTRRRILALVCLRPSRPSKLAFQLGLSRSAVSRQLALLEDAGLIHGVQSYIDGRWTIYTVNPRRHGQITAWLAGTGVGLDGAASDLRPPDRS